MTNFADTGLQPAILDAIRDLGFVEPTPIQAKTIPHLLTSDQDVIALAQTGTGKTAAFGLPAIHLSDLSDPGTQTLVLCPTRELCLQISRDLESYAKYLKGLGIVAVYGGASIETQIRQLKKNAQIVVGTPGRVNDLIRRKKLKLGGIKRVILDEADEMLTMGFKEELDTILAETPDDKQSLLFSATLSKGIERVAKNYMTDPLKMSVAATNVGAENVRHVVYQVKARDRYELLKRLADLHPNIYGIVFCRTRRDTKEVANKLRQDGYNADALHGDLSQAQRDEVMQRFRERQLQLLVATDVAARGLDVNELTHVINYILPDAPETYTHRSGRTGRAGRKGTSIAIIHSREKRKIKDIERYSKIKFEQLPAPSGREICKVQLYALIDKIVNVEVDQQQIEPFLPAAYEKLEKLSREELIQHFVSAEFNRFLEYYKGARDLNIDGPKEREDWRQVTFVRFHINLGTKHNLDPARLIGLINESLDSGAARIGKIDILKKFSFFEIQETYADTLEAAMNKMSFRGFPIAVERSQSAHVPAPRPFKGRGGRKPFHRGKKNFKPGGKKGFSKGRDRRRKRD